MLFYPKFLFICIENPQSGENVEGYLNQIHSVTEVSVLKGHAILTIVVKPTWKLPRIHSFVPFWGPQALCIWRGMCTAQIHLKPIIQVCGFLTWVLFCSLERPSEALTLSLSDIIPKFERLWSWPENSLNGPLWAQLHKEEGVLPMPLSFRRILWTECQWHRMAFTCEEINQLYLLSKWRTWNEKFVSKQVLFRF